jgi:hypothetical protein
MLRKGHQQALVNSRVPAWQVREKALFRWWRPKEFGLSDRNRTCDPQLRRLLLYPTELRTVVKTKKARKGLRCSVPTWVLKDGRSGGIRTRDPLLPKQMRYQAALRSDCHYFNQQMTFSE